MKDIIVIIGPTGVGKTKLSVELAKKLDAEIINGDSVAIYKKLNIGSAKPSKDEQKEVVHHLIDICDINEEYSVYNYQKDARKAIEKINKKNKTIIIVGGTGLYIKAALYNYKFSSTNNKNNEYKELTNKEILDQIKKYDPNTSVHINNRQRLIRLLNKYDNNEEITNNKDELLYPCKIIGLTTDRNNLYNRINKRVDNMIKEGLLDEVNKLSKDYNNSRILNSAIGYKEFKEYFEHKKNIEDVIEEIKRDSRRYAKRQYTFFKNQLPVKWFNTNFENFDITIKEIYEYIK